MIILIDNGHGIETKGKRSPEWDFGQVIEWEYNRRVARKLKNELADHKIHAELIVPEDTDVPLSERTKRINLIAAKNGLNDTLLISIHCNAFTTDKPRGWEIHTYTSTSDFTDFCAQTFLRTAKRLLPPDIPIRNNGQPFRSNFQILRDSMCPALLTENLFMSNEFDCRFMLSEMGFNSIVDIHLDAILNIISK